MKLRYTFSFGKLGDEWSEDEEVTHELHTLTCLTYGFAREKSVNSVRNIILSNVVGEKDELTTKFKWISPGFYLEETALPVHFVRVNYSLVNYKYAQKTSFCASIPSRILAKAGKRPRRMPSSLCGYEMSISTNN